MEDLKLDLEIYDYWYTPFWHSKYFYLILIIFFVLCFLTMFILLRKFKSKKIDDKITLEKILEQLIFIKQNKNYNETNCKELYFELTYSIKQMISLDLELDLSCITDYELVELLKNNNFSDNYVLEIEKIFNNAEVKFNQDVIRNNEIMDQDLSSTIFLVNETIKKNKELENC